MDQKTNGADPEGCAVVITLYRHYNTKLRVNGTFSRKYIWKRINELIKSVGQECPTHTSNTKINSKGKGDGQECPAYTDMDTGFLLIWILA
jgi:hypothetical protein